MLTDFFAAYLDYLVKQVDLAAESAKMTNFKYRLVHQVEFWREDLQISGSWDLIHN